MATNGRLYLTISHSQIKHADTKTGTWLSRPCTSFQEFHMSNADSMSERFLFYHLPSMAQAFSPFNACMRVAVVDCVGYWLKTREGANYPLLRRVFGLCRSCDTFLTATRIYIIANYVSPQPATHSFTHSFIVIVNG